MGARGRVVRLVVAGAILAFCATGPAESARDAAKALNAKGYAAYKQKHFAKALEHFRAAVEADETYAAAQYNLACTLGVFRKRKQYCEPGAYRPEIVQHLQIAVKLDHTWLARARRDPDLEPIHDTVGYQVLMGLDPARTEDVIRILQRVTWYGPQSGVCPNPSGLTFKAGGNMSYWYFPENCEDAPRQRRATVAGTYSVRGSSVTVRLSKPVNGRREFRGVLKPVENGEAVLLVPGLGGYEGEIDGRFSDNSSECSA